MTPPRRCVITGAPCSGKTTTVNKLAERGYIVVPEAARILIDASARLGIPVADLRRDDRLFQLAVSLLLLQQEAHAPFDRPVVFDRGVPDSIAYFLQAGLPTGELLLMAQQRYRRVFFMEQLALDSDYARTENETEIGTLTALLKFAYERTGYDLVTVPATSVDERVEVVISHLTEKS